MAEAKPPVAVPATLLAGLHQNTRIEHASLNKAIVARLPLSLPPNATSPYFYAAGLVVYSQIYVALEETWARLLKSGNETRLDTRHRELLSSLRTHNLGRSRRLASDVACLKRKLGPEASTQLDEVDAQSLHFRTTITESISARPHLVLAYAWPMYLALFNGGRWIANQLLNAGPHFWQEPETEQIIEHYLSFWYFDDSARDVNHGESVKVDFKQKFSAVSELLDDDERTEVIEEAKRVFSICADMIALLDQHAAATIAATVTTAAAPVAAVAPAPDAVTLSREQQQRTVLEQVADMSSFKRVWVGLSSAIAYVTAPATLRKDFDQPA